MKDQPEKILFVVNKHAGLGYASELEKLVATLCKKYSTEYAIDYTQYRAHATALASEARGRGFTMVAAVGGDGTINEVAQGLLHTGVAMGIIPRGSGNGLARHLGIPLKINDAITSLLTSREIAMDVFRINGRLSLNVSGLGFDGHVTNLFGVKSTRGFIGYVTVTVQEFFRFQEFAATLEVDGTMITRDAFIIAIANSSQYGNNAVIAPGASICDGLLQITILKKVPLYRFDFLQAFFSGSVERSPYCETFTGKQIKLVTSSPVSFHVDGEPCGLEKEFNISIDPGALEIRVPAHGKSNL